MKSRSTLSRAPRAGQATWKKGSSPLAITLMDNTRTPRPTLVDLLTDLAHRLGAACGPVCPCWGDVGGQRQPLTGSFQFAAAYQEIANWASRRPCRRKALKRWMEAQMVLAWGQPAKWEVCSEVCIAKLVLTIHTPEQPFGSLQ